MAHLDDTLAAEERRHLEECHFAQQWGEYTAYDALRHELELCDD
jgi:hypothetical protein